MAILPDNEYTEFENRSYVNPQVSLDEQTAFIDNLRSTQQANNQQIKTDTYNLGTAVPSNLGGLTGGEGYFTSRYQTPQTNSLANDLRAVAQASALNQILENEQAKWKNRYNKARNANAIRNANPKTPSTDGNGNIDVDTNSEDGKQKISVYNNGEYTSGKIYPVTDAVSDYQDASGQWWQLSNPDFRDVSFGPNTDPIVYRRVNENVVNVNGQDYMYLDNVPNRDPSWYRVTRSAGPGTYSPYAGS